MTGAEEHRNSYCYAEAMRTVDRKGLIPMGPVEVTSISIATVIVSFLEWIRGAQIWQVQFWWEC